MMVLSRYNQKVAYMQIKIREGKYKIWQQFQMTG